jgi:hypothetical protein
MFAKVGFRLMAALTATFIIGPGAGIAADLPPSDGAEKERAVAVARAALARRADLEIKAPELHVVSVQARVWKNSGLGCSPPRAMTQPVVSEGFAVVFATPSGATMHVHVAGGRAVICDRVGLGPPHSIAFPKDRTGS